MAKKVKKSQRIKSTAELDAVREAHSRLSNPKTGYKWKNRTDSDVEASFGRTLEMDKASAAAQHTKVDSDLALLHSKGIAAPEGAEGAARGFIDKHAGERAALSFDNPSGYVSQNSAPDRGSNPKRRFGSIFGIFS